MSQIQYNKISAAEAWKKTQEVKQNRVVQEINDIFKRIHEAIKQGESDILIDDVLYDRTVEELSALGYNVKQNYWTRETTDITTTISWYEAEGEMNDIKN